MIRASSAYERKPKVNRRFVFAIWRGLLSSVFYGLALSAVGCSSSKKKSAEDRSAQARTAQESALQNPAQGAQKAKRYQVRAQIKEVQRSGNKLYANLHHEAIPDFVNRKGKTVGMEPMVMRFRVSPSVSAEKLKSGNKVLATFAMRWKSDDPLYIEAIHPLDPTTELHLKRHEPGHKH